jgi:type IV pilus assembly protein PilQ
MNRLWTGVPEASGRWMRALACGVGAVLLAAAALPLGSGDDGNVISLSVVPTSGRAHVVIGVDGAVSVRDFALRSPDRIVVDITGARLGVRKGGYDRMVRGGVLDVRYAQNQPNVVRVVLTLAGPKRYEVTHNPGEVRISVEGGADFTAWRVGKPPLAAPALAKARVTVDTPPPGITAQVVSVTAPDPTPNSAPPLPQRPQQPRITIAWENANIRDVLAAFAAFSGRTIIPARGVDGTVTAEIIDKPWDVAMKAILNANGFDAIEDLNGIIIVSTIEALAQRPRMEALTTRTIRFNYTSASAVAEAIRGRLSRDCGVIQAPTGVPNVAQQAAQANPLTCPVRGFVSADTLTNSVSITDVPQTMDDLISYARTLDVRQPQVNIKAKIILVDRTQLEALGLKYDLGSRVQHFNDIVARIDSTGNPESGNRIFLGGNAVSAIANAQTAVPNPTLRIVYSAAIGGYQFTTFMDALQDQSLLDVQAEPSVTTLNYRQAILQAGTQVPVRTIEPGTGGNAAGAFPTVTVTMRQTGIVLRVTPSITNNRQIKMVVHAENSDVAFQGGDVGAVFPTQSIDNELLVADGETAVMGGLTQTSVRVTKTGLPLLIDLPLIGRLFGVTNRQETKRDLLILITPHIVDEGDMTMEPRRSP